MSDSKDILVVVSKLKNHIKSSSGMNTSSNVAPALSEIIRQVVARAVENARNDGRKTVMDRDLPNVMPD